MKSDLLLLHTFSTEPEVHLSLSLNKKSAISKDKDRANFTAAEKPKSVPGEISIMWRSILCYQADFDYTNTTRLHQ